MSINQWITVIIINFLVLRQPLFANVTVSEGELLELTCITRNIPAITKVQILDQHGMPLDLVTSFGIFTVPNVTREYAGVYMCVVTSIATR